MAPRYRVVYIDPHFAERFAALPKSAQRKALELLGRVANDDVRLGQPCGFQHRTGNLDDCRKLYFDVALEVEPSYRLIYRVQPNEERPGLIEAITVGPKYVVDAHGARETIYVHAGELLGRV